MRRIVLFLSSLTAVGTGAFGADLAVKNLALTKGAQARSWQTGVKEIRDHEPARATDGSLHTYWAVRAEDLPADLGVEWPEPQQLSSVIVRYFDGGMVRGPRFARTQQWAQLQYWDQDKWKSLNAQIFGQQTSSVRYVFGPVTTTRVRLLFTEPPDPEFHRTPERLGTFVSELEVYHDVPFRTVSSPGHLARIRDRHRGYNEEPPASYDVQGPLVVEPKYIHVFRDTLAPTLIVSESRWAKEPCSVGEASPRTFQLRNGFLQLEISAVGQLKETRLSNRVTGEFVATSQSTAFVIRTAEGEWTPADFKIVKVDTSGSDEQASHLRFDLTSDNANVAVHYELRRQDHFYHKWLTLTNKSNSNLQARDVIVSSLELPDLVDLMAGLELTYPISRMEQGGFFSCLEFTYWDHDGDTLTYYPGATIAAGESFDTVKAAVGVYKNRGELWNGWDRGVREWVVEYHVHISPTPPPWPDVYCEGWSANIGVKQLLESPEWTERFMATAEKLGIRYMDTYEATHQALKMPPEWIRRWMDLANHYNIGTGFWTDWGSDEDWGMGVPQKPFRCLLSPEAETFIQKAVELARTYKFQAMHWGDFLTIWPCQKAEHGHLPGKYSIYAQGQRILRYGQELHEVSPGIMLGADAGFSDPQIVRYEDSRAQAITEDDYPAAEPDIHLDRLYADMNRACLMGTHAVYLAPWYRLLNCVDHYGQETHHHDRAGFRYSLLSAVAIAGQVTFNDVPDDIPKSEIEFAQHWLNWARRNKDYLKEGDRLFDRSFHYVDMRQGDADSLSGFSHICGDRGYVFLLNPTPVEQIAELSLALDAAPSTSFAVEEVFPGGMTLRGPDNGEYPQGGRLRVTVPAKQVRILWIVPASVSIEKQNVQFEDARLGGWERYIGDWTIATQTVDAATLRSHFNFPTSGREFLSSPAPESAWSKEPWAYDKAYMVFLLKDETEGLMSNWIPDKLVQGIKKEPMEEVPAVSINGVPKTLRPFKTLRNQQENSTRCYFVDLEGEIRLGQPNEIEITLPIQTGLVFSGAYIDLPDQMPYGK